MEGVEFPLRDHKDQAEIIVREIGDVQYPLSLHDRLHYGQRFRQDVEDFTSALKTIEEKFASPSDKLPKHTEGPDCRRCRMKKKDLATAYRKFFLGSESDADQNARWDNRLMSYREKVEKLMESEDDLTLEGIEQVQALFKTELSKHNRKDLCTPQAGDPEYILILKRETAERLLAGLSFEDTLQIALAAQEQFSNLPSIGPDAQKLINFLQDPKNAQNAASAYQEYYCTIKPDDTPQQRSIKSKYSVTFGKGEPHDEVLEKWKKEALEIQAKETKDLKAQKVDLERAQKGHLRRQNGKKTEKDRRRREREMKATAEAYAERKQRMANCAMSSCEREIDLLAGDGPLECVVCDWLASKTPKGGGEGLREHAYYCSEEHVEDHFQEEHDKSQHACIMGNYCIYYPHGHEDTTAGGICRDCLDNGNISYFCSASCHDRNFGYHRDDFHRDSEVRSAPEALELYVEKPDDGMNRIEIGDTDMQ